MPHCKNTCLRILIMPGGKKRYFVSVKLLTYWSPCIAAIHAAGNRGTDTDCGGGKADFRSCCHIYEVVSSCRAHTCVEFNWFSFIKTFDRVCFSKHMYSGNNELEYVLIDLVTPTSANTGQRQDRSNTQVIYRFE